MKFNVGDKVVTEDGERGIVAFCYHDNDGTEMCDIRVGNKSQEWYAEGLRLAEEEVELLPCRKCGVVPNICKYLPGGWPVLENYYLKCDCGISCIIWGDLRKAMNAWNEKYGKKKREIKKGDVVYIKAIVGKVEVDKNEDIKCFYVRHNGDYYSTAYINEKEVFTLEELKEMK